jgi:prevent-host-death family protein
MENPNHKGNVAELAIATEAAKHGLSVFAPLTEHGRYDLIIGIGRRLLRVQCKWARKVGDVIVINLTSSRRGPDGYVRARYTADEIDAIGAYCEETGSCYLIPIDVVGEQWGLQLRLAPARNGQRAALHFAEQYLLGAVAQLAERRRGTAEARGSNPLSSITPLTPDAERVAVGAHEFRNHFGFYMERAAAGAEIAVSRRGRPYVRLVPFDVEPAGQGVQARPPHKIDRS